LKLLTILIKIRRTRNHSLDEKFYNTCEDKIPLIMAGWEFFNLES
jgi:hypothetical protein